MSIKTTRPVENAAKLGGQLPKYYTDLIAAAQSTASAALPKGGGLMTGDIFPATNNTRLLGTNALRWRQVKATEFIAIHPGAGAGGEDFMRMTAESHQIINSHATDALKLCANGGVWVRNFPNGSWTAINASAFTQQSSVRFKDILGDMTRERARKVLELNLIKYRYKVEYDDNPKTHYGIKAEQADELELWDFVEYSIHDGQPEAVDYSKLTPYLIGVAKDHDERIGQLEKKAAKYDALAALLVSKGVCTQEEIDGLEAAK